LPVCFYGTLGNLRILTKDSSYEIPIIKFTVNVSNYDVVSYVEKVGQVWATSRL